MGILNLTEKRLENVKQKTVSGQLLERNLKVYVEPYQIYMMELFAEIVNGFWRLNNFDIMVSSSNISGLPIVQ